MLSFFMAKSRGASPVIFGEEDDSLLLGIVTLGALGLTLDPIHRVLPAASFGRFR